MLLPISYTDFKALRLASNATLHAGLDSNGHYNLAISVDGIVRTCTVLSGTSDHTDFVTNLLSLANIPTSGGSNTVYVSDPANSANKLKVDSNGRLAVVVSPEPIPGIVYVERVASSTFGIVTNALLQNSSTALATYPTNNINYTVPAGKTFYLTDIDFIVDTSTVGRRISIAVAVAGVKKFWLALDSAYIRQAGKQFVSPIVAGAGEAVTILVTTNGTGCAIAVRFSGQER